MGSTVTSGSGLVGGGPGAPGGGVLGSGQIPGTAGVDLPTLAEQRQFKVQLLLHLNSVLLARAMQQSRAQGGGAAAAAAPEAAGAGVAQLLRRVHANLQCISQLNQGRWDARPAILDPPESGEDILAKMYLLAKRLFEVW